MIPSQVNVQLSSDLNSVITFHAIRNNNNIFDTLTYSAARPGLEISKQFLFTVYPSLNNNQDKLSPPPPLLLAGWYIESRAESKHIHLS